MKGFKEFLRSSYSLKRATAIENRGSRGRKKKQKPQLLIVSRSKTRSFTNIEDVSKLAKKLGFKVLVVEPDINLKKVGEIVNSCDVMMGVHGAGLTNIVFLPEKAVLIQIVPFGEGDWEPQTSLESLEKSTLIQQYPKEDVVLRDPQTIEKQGWSTFKSIYFHKQNVSLDINRFRPTLLKALELLQY